MEISFFIHLSHDRLKSLNRLGFIYKRVIDYVTDLNSWALNIVTGHNKTIDRPINIKLNDVYMTSLSGSFSWRTRENKVLLFSPQKRFFSWSLCFHQTYFQISNRQRWTSSLDLRGRSSRESKEREKKGRNWSSSERRKPRMLRLSNVKPSKLLREPEGLTPSKPKLRYSISPSPALIVSYRN